VQLNREDLIKDEGSAIKTLSLADVDRDLMYRLKAAKGFDDSSFWPICSASVKRTTDVR